MDDVLDTEMTLRDLRSSLPATPSPKRSSTKVVSPQDMKGRASPNRHQNEGRRHTINVNKSSSYGHSDSPSPSAFSRRSTASRRATAQEQEIRFLRDRINSNKRLSSIGPERRHDSVTSIHADRDIEASIETLRREQISTNGTINHLNDVVRQLEGEKNELRSVCLKKVELDKKVLRLKEETMELRAQLEDSNSQLEKEKLEKVQLLSQQKQHMSLVQSESNRQIQSLKEQLHTSKELEHAATDDLEQATREFELRKSQLLEFLDSEKNEKQAIIADYRKETDLVIDELQGRIKKQQQAIEKHQQFESELRSNLTEMDNRMQVQSKQLTTLQNDNEKLKETNRKEVQSERSRHEKEVNKLGTELTHLQGELSRMTTQYQQALLQNDENSRALHQQLHREREKIETTLQTTIATNNQENAQLQLEIDSLKRELASTTEGYSLTMSKVSENNEVQLEGLRRELETLRKEKLLSLEEHREERERMASDFVQRSNQLQEHAEQLRLEVNTEKTSRAEVETELQATRLKVEQLTTDLQAIRKKVEAQSEASRESLRSLEKKHSSELQRMRKEFVIQENTEKELRAEISRLGDDQRRLEDSVVVAEQKGKHAESDAIRKLESDLLNTNHKLATTESAYRDLEAKLERQQNKRLELEEEVSMATNIAENERSASREALSQLEQQTSKLREVQESESSLRIAHQKLIHQQEDYLSQISKMTSIVAEKESALNICESEKSQLREEMMGMRNDNSDLQDVISRSQKEFSAQLVEADRKFTSELGRMEQQLDEFRQEKRSLEAVNEESEVLITKLKEELQKTQEEAEAVQQVWRERNELASREQAHFVRKLQVHVEELCTRVESLTEEKQRDKREFSTKYRQLETQLSELRHEKETQAAENIGLKEEIRAKDDLLSDKQSTVMLLQSKLQSRMNDMTRNENDIKEMTRRLQLARSEVSKRESEVSHLQSKLRVSDLSFSG
eukprot:TRINITY_DN6123_c0_g1_i1.p1 TRINITY_DN6123_c0_g1~~TRINITY_DN6123_c0_g1_i1.p1  ORF type:complete len:969 (+),score=276.96 TRINITY_DN6123_c0_g1_i1:39-2945(+)